MRDEYTARVTDLPTVITILTRGSRTKTVKDYFGAPPALKEIEQRIDDVSGVGRFVRDDKDDLDAALARGDASAVKRLLAAGADPRTRNADGVTLVMKAAVSGDPETVRAVLTAGGDPTARDLAGRNAADRVRDLMARDPRNPKLAEILRLLTDE
jgi:ankyrin repeat protein